MNDEEKKLYKFEIDWREKKINELHQYIAYKRLEEAKARQPKDYTKIFFIIAILLLTSLLDVWNYGRNFWQMLAANTNSFLWSIKDWWY